jgi:ABC-type branched-subunit amino acid transport system ATPase component
MLKIENLVVSYRRHRSLEIDQLEVPDGSIVTIIGANGRKEFYLRAIIGL